MNNQYSMTDNEIIKALECCINDDCDNCPDTFGNCEHNAMRNALDLINRQKAEIERLTKANERFAEEFDSYYAYVKSEAIKEFAERLKKGAYPFPCAIGVENAVTIRAINDLVEEMTEDGK